MKTIIGCFLFSFICSLVFSQNVNQGKNKGNDSLNTQDVSGKYATIEIPKNTTGTPYLSDQWGKGMIQVRNGKWLSDVNIMLNLLTNQLYVKNNNASITIASNISQFVISYRSYADVEMLYYKSDYPAFDQNTERTFYRVLVNGKKIHFLRFDYKTIEDDFSPNELEVHAFKEKHQYFVFDVRNNRLESIQISEAALEKALPDFTAAIQQYIHVNNIKLHSEDELTALVKYLNE